MLRPYMVGGGQRAGAGPRGARKKQVRPLSQRERMKVREKL